MALAQKSDFPTYVQFTENIEDRLLDFHISDAETLDFAPRVPVLFYDNVVISQTASPANELNAFWQTYIIPLIVLFSYQRYLLWAGRQNTQYGLVQIREDTSEPITRQDRADLINDIKSKTNVYLTRFYNELRAKSHTFDGVVYNFDICHRKVSLKIRAV